MADWRSFAAEVARFLAAGVGNTMITIVVYQLYVDRLGPMLAYVVSWFVGLMLVLGLYPRFVFHRQATLRTAGRLSMIYGTAFVLGCGVTAGLAWLNMPVRLIVFVAAGVTSAFSYLCARWALQPAPVRS